MHYSYDPGGRLVTRTDALGQITAYAYDAGDHVVTIDLPGPDLEQYAYDRVGNLVEASNTHDPIVSTMTPCTGQPGCCTPP